MFYFLYSLSIINMCSKIIMLFIYPKEFAMKYKKRNRLEFDKKLIFNHGNLFSRKNLLIVAAAILVISLFLLLPKFSKKTIVIDEGLNKGPVKTEKVEEEVFLEELNVKVKRIDLKKEYGIETRPQKTADEKISESNEILEFEEEAVKSKKRFEKGLTELKNDKPIYEYLKEKEEE